MEKIVAKERSGEGWGMFKTPTPLPQTLIYPTPTIIVSKKERTNELPYTPYTYAVVIDRYNAHYYCGDSTRFLVPARNVKRNKSGWDARHLMQNVEIGETYVVSPPRIWSWVLPRTAPLHHSSRYEARALVDFCIASIDQPRTVDVRWLMHDIGL